MQTTLANFGQSKLRHLCEAIKLRHQTARACEIFTMMSESWSKELLLDKAPWPNDITDDETPFEFSIAFNEHGQTLRMLFESEQWPRTSTSSFAAGLRFNEKIRQFPGVDLGRFEKIRDLFAPADNVPHLFSLWHAVNFTAAGGPVFKIYLNPQVRGVKTAHDIVREALLRLKMNDAWEFLQTRFSLTSPPIFFSLDLTESSNARVKVYIAQTNATHARIESLAQGCHGYVSGDATSFIEAASPGTTAFGKRPLQTCFAFSSVKDAPIMTIHVPVRSYASSDKEILQNARGLLKKEQAELLTNAVIELAHRPLDAGTGLITYISARREGKQQNITVYLAPEAFSCQSGIYFAKK